VELTVGQSDGACAECLCHLCLYLLCLILLLYQSAASLYYLRDTLRIFTSTLYGKTKTNTNPDPNRYRRRCPDPNAVIQKKELQIKTEEDGNFKAKKYKIEGNPPV